MEAVTLDLATSIDRAKEPVEHKKENDSIPPRNGDSFLSILKNLTSRLETENTHDNLENTDTDNLADSLQARIKGRNTSQLKQDNLDKTDITHSKEKTMTDLEYDFDEEVRIREMLAQIENAEAVPISAISERSTAPVENTLSQNSTSERPKSLLQSLMEHDATKLNDDVLSELVQQAEKGKFEHAQGKVKKFDALASVRINKNTDDKNPTETSISVEPNTKKILKKISVEDYRNANAQSNEAISFGTHKSGSEERVSTESISPKELTIELPALNSETVYTLVDNTQTISANETNSTQEASSFSQLLAQQLLNTNEDIVQAGKIILRDNNEGVIRLQLQPAQLGRVRIELEMQEDKKLSGKIFVDSKEALSAFEESIHELIAEFEKNGFTTTGFQLSLNYSENQQMQFNETQTFFGFSDLYEDDLLLRSSVDLSENITGFGQAETINILA